MLANLFRQYLFKITKILKKYLAIRCVLSVYVAVSIFWNQQAADNRSIINQLSKYWWNKLLGW